MLRRNLKKLALGAAALAMAIFGGVPQANAFWGHSSGGSWGGSYGGYGGYAGYGSYGSYGSWGSSGGSAGYAGYASYGGSWGGHHHRHHRRAYYYSSGSYGSYGSSGGSYGGYGSSGGSSGGSYGSWGSSGGTVIEGPAVPATNPPPPPPSTEAPMLDPNAPAPEPGEIPPAAPDAGDSTSFNSATLNVHVPADAKVYVNGLATKSTGADRRYISNGLERGYSYSYEIRAEFVRDGRTVSQTKVVKLRAGASSNVTFDANADQEQVAEQPVNTSLTLYVPADAKVFLSGNETRGEGEVRRFSTTKLAAGKQWQDYQVRVEVQRKGRTLSKEETVSLKGGDARELTIEFSAPQVAQTSVDRQ